VTAVVSMIQGDRAYLLVDTAWTADDGRLMALSPKMIQGTGFPWAIAISGNLHPSALITEISRVEPKNARQLANALPRVLRRTTEKAAEIGQPLSIGLTLAAWSGKAKRPAIIIVDNDGGHFGAFTQPFEPVEVDWTCGTEPADILGREVSLSDPASFAPRTDGIALMDGLRRRHAWAWREGAAVAHRIGGGLQLATITKRGVTVEDLRDWQDKLGKLIDPLAPNTKPQPCAGSR